MREFLKQYLTEKQNGYLQSGRLRVGGRLQEVVARREVTVVLIYMGGFIGLKA